MSFQEHLTPAALEEWKQEAANVDRTVELAENGFKYRAGSLTYDPTWAEIDSVYQSERLLIFCDGTEYSLLIPKRSFTSEKQLREFLEIAYEKTVGPDQQSPEGRSSWPHIGGTTACE
ncbi:MAG TPA: YcxB family protein [Anaerolineales bacterium]|nr:YcxB family protein [Anaerolineales bacterium]